MKKVLVINTAGLGMGGITTHMLSFLDFFQNVEIQIDVVATMIIDEDIVSSFKNIGCRVIRLYNRKKCTLIYVLQLIGLLWKNHYDVVHVHGNSSTMIIEVALAKMLGIKKRIVHCHNTICSYPRINQMLNVFFEKTYTHALACSEDAGRWLFGNEFSVLHNAINIDRFLYNERKRCNTRKELGVGKELLLGHIGVFNEQKNHEFLIEFFFDLRKKIDSKLVLIGEGENIDKIKSKVKYLKLENDVIFLGRRKDIPDLLCAMDVFVFPSKWEGLGIVLVEAQACGLPCVVSDAVPNEVKLSENVTYINLKDKKKWIETVYDLRNGKKRDIDRNRFSNYDIQFEVNKLKKLYLE